MLICSRVGAGPESFSKMTTLKCGGTHGLRPDVCSAVCSVAFTDGGRARNAGGSRM